MSDKVEKIGITVMALFTIGWMIYAATHRTSKPVAHEGGKDYIITATAPGSTHLPFMVEEKDPKSCQKI
jgi:hypothetical protein